MPVNLNIEVVTALIAAVASLVVAIIGFIGGRKNERDLEELRAKLTESQSERDARRDYEYEARKRLYHEFEPLLFQFVELAESAQRRIGSIARTARQGNLGLDQGWLSRESYYFAVTMYKLIAPLVIVRLIQRRLTLVDLTVDPKINVQYALMKRLYNSFTDDFDLARMEPVIEYDPNPINPVGAGGIVSPKHSRQGIYSGRLDNVIDSLIVYESSGQPRCMSFGELEDALGQADSAVINNFGPMMKLVRDFHPQVRPVLWRILIVQLHLYRLLLTLSRMPTLPAAIQIPILLTIPVTERRKYDWRHRQDEAPDEVVLEEPFRIAEAHLKDQLNILFP